MFSCLGATMVLSKEKRVRLAEAISRRQGALGGAGASAPSAPIVAVPLAAAQASPTPTPLEKDKGVVAIESDDKDIGEGLVFKTQRVVGDLTFRH